jgi:hypothetical protein
MVGCGVHEAGGMTRRLWILLIALALVAGYGLGHATTKASRPECAPTTVPTSSPEPTDGELAAYGILRA